MAMHDPADRRLVHLSGPAEIVTDDLDQLLEVLPPHICDPLIALQDRRELLEVVMDMGREPEARLPGREVVLSTHLVTEEDIDYVVQRIGTFGDDNRAGIERTLHRISAIRNREGRIVGITCRVGRAVFGTITIIRDIVESGRSILMMGRPGVGKTTLLREAARVLADDLRKRVMIVDTSNEIGGDGDIPHPAVGRARRMQVPTPTQQHAVMIEAVENHMPEVIVIDEIGTELEAGAARTIAERGVQLVATAHGNTLENLMMNPTLSDLIGGIQSVTLSDEEARRRGTQKSVLERKAPPTFDVVVEIQNWSHVAVHENVADVVDAVLRGQPVVPTVRRRGTDGEVLIEEPLMPRARTTALPDADHPAFSPVTSGGWLGRARRARARSPTSSVSRSGAPRRRSTAARPPAAASPGHEPTFRNGRQAVRIYPFGVNRSRLESQIRSLGSTGGGRGQSARVGRGADGAQLLPAQAAGAARRRGERGAGARAAVELGGQYRAGAAAHLAPGRGARPGDGAERLARDGGGHRARSGDLGAHRVIPQSAYIRRLQHQLAEQHSLSSRSTGKEPYRRVRISKAD